MMCQVIVPNETTAASPTEAPVKEPAPQAPPVEPARRAAPTQPVIPDSEPLTPPTERPAPAPRPNPEDPYRTCSLPQRPLE